MVNRIYFEKGNRTNRLRVDEDKYPACLEIPSGTELTLEEVAFLRGKGKPPVEEVEEEEPKAKPKRKLLGRKKK